jgi:hypothetical protein
MSDMFRIFLRLVGVACMLVGIIGLVRPFKNYNKDSLYNVTTYSRRSGNTISEKIQTGAELESGQREGALFMIGAGIFFIWITKRKFNE